jgi:hypothetical protein
MPWHISYFVGASKTVKRAAHQPKDCLKPPHSLPPQPHCCPLPAAHIDENQDVARNQRDPCNFAAQLWR